MIDISEFSEYMNSGEKIAGRSDINECMHWLSQEALRLTAELNGSYHMPNPTVEKLYEGVQIARDNQVDFIDGWHRLGNEWRLSYHQS